MEKKRGQDGDLSSGTKLYRCHGKEEALSLIRCTPGTMYEGGALSCYIVSHGERSKVRQRFVQEEAWEVGSSFTVLSPLSHTFLLSIKIYYDLPLYIKLRLKSSFSLEDYCYCLGM